MHKKQKENISLTFHYLLRSSKDDNGNPIEVAITNEEFNTLYTKLDILKNINYRDKANAQIQTDIISQKIVPIVQLEQFNDRYITGIHLKSYSGHEIENIDFGKIPKDSINLRRFFFILYHSPNGRIYIGSQALGNYSGYVPLRDTLKSLFIDQKGLLVASVNSTGYLARNAIIKEAHLNYSQKSNDIAKNNTFGKRGVVIFKDGDENFSHQIKTSILPFLDKEKKEIKKGISQVVTDNTLVAMNDDDLDECKLIVESNGNTRTIHMIDKTGWPTHFDTGLEPSTITGHPEYIPLKEIALKILEEEIIDKS